jgi:Holliday junction resolvasome RuvABC DNA-binding subunit
MKKTVLLSVCGVGAKCALNTLIISANLAALGMLVAREFIDERL